MFAWLACRRPSPVVIRLFLLAFVTTFHSVDSIGRVNPPETLYTAALKKQAADELLRASSDFVQWALATLAGIAAVVVTTKVHRSSGYESAYIALGPAGALVIMSLLAASELHGRYANSTAFGDFSDVDNIALLLVAQRELFMGGIACAGIFVLWYLANIVAGRVQPFEQNGNQGGPS